MHGMAPLLPALALAAPRCPCCATRLPQPGPAGDALCLAACKDCLSPLRVALEAAERSGGRGPLWGDVVGPLKSVVAAGLQRSEALQEAKQRAQQEKQVRGDFPGVARPGHCVP